MPLQSREFSGGKKKKQQKPRHSKAQQNKTKCLSCCLAFIVGSRVHTTEHPKTLLLENSSEGCLHFLFWWPERDLEGVCMCVYMCVRVCMCVGLYICAYVCVCWCWGVCVGVGFSPSGWTEHSHDNPVSSSSRSSRSDCRLPFFPHSELLPKVLFVKPSATSQRPSSWALGNMQWSSLHTTNKLSSCYESSRKHPTVTGTASMGCRMFVSVELYEIFCVLGTVFKLHCGRGGRGRGPWEAHHKGW